MAARRRGRSTGISCANRLAAAAEGCHRRSRRDRFCWLVITVGALWAWPAMRTASTPSATAVAAATPRPRPLVAPRQSIVVLPFTNRSDDPKQQYFADGITDDLTTDLSRLSNMLVISRDGAFTYKDKPVNAKDIGRELGVRYLLEGSVQRSGNQVRINAQLIDAEADTHLWAERFDRE